MQDLRIHKVGAVVAEGVRIEFLRNGQSEWSTSLGQLSGGQRTLASLCLILAVRITDSNVKP